jgi:hypothetical protein
MSSTSSGRRGHRTADAAGAQDRPRRHWRFCTGPHYAASRCGESHHIQGSFHVQLDLFDAVAPADPLSGHAVRLPDTCSKCGHLVAIVGPGKAPHAASLLCRACGLHRGWISRANHTFLNEIINKFGAPTEPIVFRNQSAKPEQNHDGVSIVQGAKIPGGENGNTV